MKVYAAALTAALTLVMTGVAHSADSKAMDRQSMAKQDKSQATHKAVGVVKKVDSKAGTISLAHEAVKTLDWPAMTMTFKVQDPALLGKAAVGKKVEFEFQQRGKDYLITSMKAG